MKIILNDDEVYEFKDFLPVDDLMKIGMPNLTLIAKLQENKLESQEDMMALISYFKAFLECIQIKDTEVGKLSFGSMMAIISHKKMQECIGLSFGQNLLDTIEKPEEASKNL